MAEIAAAQRLKQLIDNDAFRGSESMEAQDLLDSMLDRFTGDKQSAGGQHDTTSTWDLTVDENAGAKVVVRAIRDRAQELSIGSIASKAQDLLDEFIRDRVDRQS